MTEFMLIVMVVLLLCGFPMKMPLISAAVLGFLVYFPDMSLQILIQQMIGGVKPAALTAVPMFILAADIITRGHSANRLIDVVMIANLLLMVIVGGYETFVSRLRLEQHPDRPEWLSHVNAGVLKVKLAMALIGISSIHLLKSFINAENMDSETLKWQVIIHVVFLLSALAMAATDRLIAVAHVPSKQTNAA